MQIILSPAKKMKVDTDSFPCRSLPQLLPKTEQLYERLRGMSYQELKALWKCSDAIAKVNMERLETMDLRRNLTPAILAYEGIQYQYMAPGVFSDQALAYVEEHLRILSGFYGVLRPFDGVTPYRLEMQAKLSMGQGKDLYSFWGDSIAETLFSETDCILNLASKEYSRCVSSHLNSRVKLITVSFCERKEGKLIEKGTLCKMARGEMVRYLAEHQIQDPEQIRDFHRLGYRFSPEESNDTTYTFIKEEP
ncbi:MAG: peroxide stress protein YaaA [Clostridiales bacterium]|nr:peroxide stress protein YaaA [Clostridiales bacterium]